MEEMSKYISKLADRFDSNVIISDIPSILNKYYNIEVTIPIQYSHLKNYTFDFMIPYSNGLYFVNFDDDSHFEFKHEVHKSIQDFKNKIQRDIDKTKLIQLLPNCRLLHISSYCDNIDQCLNWFLSGTNIIEFSDSSLYSSVWLGSLSKYPTQNNRQVYCVYDYVNMKIMSAYRKIYG